MSNKSTAQNAVVKFPERVKKSANETARKWGKSVVDHGFTIVPSLLLKAQARLNITATEMAVLLQIMDHWWDSGKMPYPGKKLLADRLGMQPRQIQRHTASLEEKGLLTRIQRYGSSHKGKLSNEYNLDGLVEKLKALEPEFTDAKNAERRLEKRRGINYRD